MFTVGYGDIYPHTVVGKIAAMILMMAGLALFGWVTAALASVFVSGDKKPKEERARLSRQLEQISERLAAIEARLASGETDAEAQVRK